MEIDRDIVPKFVDPVFWLHYFPPIAKHDLIEMGVKVDWRRSLSPPLQNTYMHTHRPALAHRVSRPRGTGSVGDSVGEGAPCLVLYVVGLVGLVGLPNGGGLPNRAGMPNGGGTEQSGADLEQP